VSARRHAALASALVATVATVAAGCAAVGPDYTVPERALVRDPGAAGAFTALSPAVTAAPPPERWWQLYRDPVLDGLVERALAANADLRTAAARLAQAHATYESAAAAGEPRLDASARAARARFSGEQYLQPEALPPMNVGDAGIEASYQLDLFGRLARAAEAAGADEGASAAALDVARVTVAGDVVGAYVEACGAGHEFEKASATVAVQERALDATTRLAAAGRGTTVDVTRSRALLEQSRSELPGLLARRRVALYRLATLGGRPPAEFPAGLDDCRALPTLAAPLPVGDGARLLARRPDVREAERRLAAATARIGVATANLYPTVTLGLGAGSTGLLADLGSAPANRWSLGPLISWSIPGGGERARVRAAGAAADAALAHFDAVVLTALRDVETALTVYARDLDQNASLAAAQDAAREADRQARELYHAGRVPFLNALEAERTLGGVERARAASDTRIAADQVRLFLALGGGWQGAPAVAAVPRAAGAGGS
jgi:NodT family efflux transporter outer membrane factor (OMF) lipoprotein